IRRDHPHLAHPRQRLGKRGQTRRVNPIIVGDENTHLLRKKKLPAAASSVDLGSRGHPGDLSDLSYLVQSLRLHSIWSGRADLNGRPLAPQASTLPGCATPRHALFNFTMSRILSLEAGGMQPTRKRRGGMVVSQDATPKS